MERQRWPEIPLILGRSGTQYVGTAKLKLWSSFSRILLQRIKHFWYECFIRGSKHRESNESTRQQAECFYCFEVFGTPDETRSTSFWCGFSNETIGNYAVTCFRTRNNKKLCTVKYFPFSERTRLYAWFISVQPRARKEQKGVGAKNGLRRRELSSPSTRYKTKTRKLF